VCQSVSVVDVHSSTLGNFSISMPVVPTTHLFGRNGTMMTRAISTREAGNPIRGPVTPAPCVRSGIPACWPHAAVDRDGARRQNSA
jgi:hypothetical protein